MKHFTLAAVLLSATAISSSAFAQDDDGFHPTSSIASVSEYVFRGVSLGGASLQPSTEISTDFGLTVGAWYSAGLGSDSSVQADEIDLYANYSVPLDAPISLDVGGTYYYYPQSGSLFETDNGVAGSYEVYGSVGFDEVVLSPAATVYYDFTLESLTLEGSVSHSVPLPRAGWTADLGVTGGHVDFDSGFDYQWATATVALNKTITDNISFYVSGNFTLNSEELLGFEKETVQATGLEFATVDSDTQLWLGTGLSVSY